MGRALRHDRIKAGLKPLTSKKTTALVDEPNAPIVLDQILGWVEWECRLQKLIVHMDETKLHYGIGCHAERGRGPAGMLVRVMQPYRWKNATVTIAIHQSDMYKFQYPQVLPGMMRRLFSCVNHKFLLGMPRILVDLL